MVFGMIRRIRSITKATKEKKDEDALRIGVLGAANIAPLGVIYPASKLTNCVVTAVAARNRKKAEKYAKRYKIPNVYDSYEDLINSEEIDVIYNPLPNGSHAYYSIMALQKGKHVLCEKPLASNADEVKAMMEAQENAPLNPRTNSKPMLMEAFHVSFHPLLRKMVEVIRSGEIGDVKKITTNFVIPSFGFSKKDIRYNCNGKYPQLAGGVMMDVGCYAIHVTRRIAETFLGGKSESAFPDFNVDKASLHEAFKNVKGVDQEGVFDLTFSNDEARVEAQLKASYRGWGLGTSCSVEGTKGTLYFCNFIAPYVYHYATIKDAKTKKTRTIKEYGSGATTYDYQLEYFINAVLGSKEHRELCELVGGTENALRNMEIIDAVYKKGGLEPRSGLDLSSLQV